jgi:hypothetical protein
MGCTIRIEDRLVRVVEGKEKSSALSPEKRPSVERGQSVHAHIYLLVATRCSKAVSRFLLTCCVSDSRPFASIAIAPAKDAEIITLITA